MMIPNKSRRGNVVIMSFGLTLYKCIYICEVMSWVVKWLVYLRHNVFIGNYYHYFLLTTKYEV